jgi:hypothetical protein
MPQDDATVRDFGGRRWSPRGRPPGGWPVSGLRAGGAIAGLCIVLVAAAPEAAAIAPGSESGSGPGSAPAFGSTEVIDPGAFRGLVPPRRRDPITPSASESRPQWRPRAKAGAVTLRLTQPQLRSVWCAPAAGRAALSAVISRPPAQRWLATAMGTGADGTLMSAIAPALNRAQRRNRYQLDFATSPRVLLSRVRMDVERYRSAVIIGVDPGQLPWYEGLIPLGGGHAVVVHGYSVTAGGSDLLVWDPARSPLAGRHTTSTSSLTAAGVRFGGAIVW